MWNHFTVILKLQIKNTFNTLDVVVRANEHEATLIPKGFLLVDNSSNYQKP